MKGHPASLTIDLGVVVVIGRNRVAKPPASKASGGILSNMLVADIIDQRRQGFAEGIAGTELACPAKAMDPICVEANDRNVTLPPTIATRVFENWLCCQCETFGGKLGNLGDRD